MNRFNQLSFGVCVMPTDLILPPAEIAVAVEKAGLDSLFFAENSHVPIVHSKNKYHCCDFALCSFQISIQIQRADLATISIHRG